MQLSKQPGSQTVTLPWSTLWAYVDFPQEVPCKQPMGPAQGAPKGSAPPVPAVSANTPASNTASAPKMESDDDSPLSSLKSSTSKTPPTESHQAAEGSTKRKRKGSTSTKPANKVTANDTKNARDARQSSSKRRKSASTTQSARHRRILRQFWHPKNPSDMHGGHIGDEWEEFVLKTERRGLLDGSGSTGTRDASSRRRSRNLVCHGSPERRNWLWRRQGCDLITKMGWAMRWWRRMRD